tara:strand:+ start:28 stop:1365 length:1338 start_codon:yes stop_codon:yes gene_type:complete
MANIFKPKYGEGHKIIIKPSISGKVKTILSKYGFVANKTVFEIIRRKIADKSLTKIDLGSGPFIVLKIVNSSKMYKFMGAKTTIESIFDHSGRSSGKSATDKLTKTKELVSLCIFEQDLKYGKKVSEDFVEQCLPRDLKQYYDSVYYTSAQSQLKAFKNKMAGKFKGNYIYERQADKVTKRMYEVAQKLSGLQKDNWNPADIWLIKNTFRMADIEKSETIEELNVRLIKEYKKGNLLGISLKQVTGPMGKLSFVNEKLGSRPEIGLNFEFERMSLSDSFNNAIIETKDKFAVRIGYKASSDNYNVYLEGRMVGSGVNMGAVDAKKFPNYVLERYGYRVRKEPVEPNIAKDYGIAKKEYQEIFNKYGANKLTNSNKITSFKDLISVYDDSPVFVKKRFIKLVTFIYPYLISTFKKGGVKEFKHFMEWNYFTAKKITDKGGFYMLLS